MYQRESVVIAYHREADSAWLGMRDTYAFGVANDNKAGIGIELLQFIHIGFDFAIVM